MIQNSSQAFLDGHTRVKIVPLSTVIRDLQIQVAGKRHRDPGQVLVLPA